MLYWARLPPSLSFYKERERERGRERDNPKGNWLHAGFCNRIWDVCFLRVDLSFRFLSFFFTVFWHIIPGGIHWACGSRERIYLFILKTLLLYWVKKAETQILMSLVFRGFLIWSFDQNAVWSFSFLSDSLGIITSICVSSLVFAFVFCLLLIRLHLIWFEDIALNLQSY